MKSLFTTLLLVGALTAGGMIPSSHAQGTAPEGFVSIFNGQNLNGWVVPQGDGGHWTVVNGAIDYDALSEADDKTLWSEGEYGDFVLLIDWRIKEVSNYTNPNVPIIKVDGTHKLDENGDPIRMAVPDGDSGIIPRGHGKAQHNIWNWPYGSGELYGYRMDSNQAPEVRRAAVPLVNADNDIGQWNTSEITVRDQYMTVKINGHLVIDRIHLNEMPPSGPIGLQHHGGMRDGEWYSPPSLVQFRNIYVKELD